MARWSGPGSRRCSPPGWSGSSAARTCRPTCGPRSGAPRRRLWTAIDATRAYRNSELWSWTYKDGAYRVAPFGASAGDADEFNAAQLWSTVFLAIPPPRTGR